MIAEINTEGAKIQEGMESDNEREQIRRNRMQQR